MDNQREIDLKLLCYYGFKRWRIIIIIGLCVSLVTGIGKTRSFVKIYNNSESMEQARTQYEILVQEHEAKGIALENDLENMKKTQSQQLLYNQNSILMDINPYNEYVGSFCIYVDTDYQIMPDKVYQNVDKTGNIVDIYESYLRSGELFSKINKVNNQTTEERYLTELINVTRNGNLLTIYVKNIDEISCKNLANALKQVLEEKTTEIKSIFGDFEYSITNESYYSWVDSELDTYQQEKTKSVTDLTGMIAEVTNKYSEWSSMQLPTFQYEPENMIKTVIKLMMFSGIIGSIVVLLWFGFLAIFTDKVLSSDELKIRLGLNVLGELPNKHDKCIDKRIDKFFHIRPIPSNALDVYGLICSRMEVSKDYNSKKTIALVGASGQKELNDLLSNLKKARPEFNLVVAGDISTQANAIDMVKKSDGVILVEMISKSKFTFIKDEIQTINSWDKEIIGAIVI